MLEIAYNYLIIYFFIFLTIITNKYYFNFKNIFFIGSLFLHLFFTFIYVKVFPTGDWETFMWSQQEGVKQLNLDEISFSSFRTSSLVVTIIFFSKKFLFFSNLTIILMFSIISFFGIVIFIQNLIKLGLEKNIACWLLFIPGVHFWTGIVGKDALLIFILSCFFSFYIDRKLIISLILVFLVWLIRPHIGALFLLSILMTEFFLVKSFKIKIILMIVLCITFYSLLNIPITKGYFLSNSELVGDNIFLKILNQFSDLAMKYEGSSSSYKNGNILSNIFSYIMFPTNFIFDRKSMVIDMVVAVEIATFIYITFIISNHKKKVEIDKKITCFLIISVLFYLITMPQVLFNFGLNIRQKWMILPFVIYLSFSLKNLLVKINKI